MVASSRVAWASVLACTVRCSPAHPPIGVATGRDPELPHARADLGLRSRAPWSPPPLGRRGSPRKERCSTRTHAWSSGQALTTTPAASAPRANSHVTRRAETVLPSTFSFPAPSLVLDPVQALCSPERSTFASKRFLRLSLNAAPHVSRCKRGVTEGVRHLKCRIGFLTPRRRTWKALVSVLTRAFVRTPLGLEPRTCGLRGPSR